jgi:hypothetical protein
MSNIHLARSSTPAAQRMRRYRKRRREGLDPFASRCMKPTATSSFAWAF